MEVTPAALSAFDEFDAALRAYATRLADFATAVTAEQHALRARGIVMNPALPKATAELVDGTGPVLDSFNRLYQEVNRG